MSEKVSILISQSEIEIRIQEIANEISSKYEGKNITLVCVLKGGVIFMVDLAKKLTVDVEFDFMDISSYGESTESSGLIKINKDLENPIEGKHVVLVEDIIDTGRTISHVVNHLNSQNPASLIICTLLDKPDRRVISGITPDYIGFTIPDLFVIGYGLDYAQKYRNLPYIGKIEF